MKTPAGVAPVIMSLYLQLDAGQLELIGSLVFSQRCIG